MDIATVTGAYKTGKEVVSDFKEVMNTVRDMVENVEDYTNLHLSNYIKKSMVSSRVFIQKRCIEDPILNDVLGSIQQLYLCWIMTAIGMNQHVDNMRTVRNLMDVVSTEGFRENNATMRDDVELINGLSSFNGMNNPIKFAVSKTPAPAMVDVTPKDINLSYGRLVEINFTGVQGNTIAIHMFVQLLPFVIPENVMEQFLKLNYKPDLKQRWFQWKAGEVSLWNFLFETDYVKQKYKALKDDKTGALQEMYNELEKNLKNKAKKRTLYAPNKQNVASTIHIYDKMSFTHWCNDSHIDFKRQEHRDKYFTDTMSMIVATIDSSYEKVELYFAGIDNKAEYTFQQIKTQSKNTQYDLSTVLKAFSNASAPRF